MPRRSADGSGSPETAVGLMEPGSASSPVEVRPGAAVNPDIVNVFEQAVSPGAAPGLHLVRLGDRPAGDAIALSVLAWVRNIAYDKDVWVDLYVLGEGGVLHAETIPLAFQEPAEGGGDFFAAGAAVPAPKTGPETSAMAMLQFRIYGQMNGRLFTDGILHSHPIEATPVKKAAPKPAAVTTAADPTAEPAAEPAAPKPPRKAAAPKAAKMPKAAGGTKPAAAPKARKPKTPKA
jgi:pyruvate/2-oxoglutarate dehydrogenase complex dihydrolipoamide acyltransferase (E2) component